MQKFKGDALELQFEAAGQALLDNLAAGLDSFEDDAYIAYPLGDLIYTSNRSPLANAIDQGIFREAFPNIFNAFTLAGSFESYIDVFQKIFGDEVGITFTVLAPGRLQIALVADEVILSELLARRVVDGAYIFDEVIDYDGDNIVTQTVKGFQSEYELNQMLYEMVPDGIFTEITLSFGEE